MKPGHLVTYLLAGASVLLLLVAAAMMAGLGSRVKPAPPAIVNTDPDLAPPPALNDRLGELVAYQDIVQRPLFNEDRLPKVAEPGPDDDVDGKNPFDTGPEVDLAVTIAGIVVTPNAKLAMVRDERTKKTVVMREGMPLEGEQASWTLTSIEPRRLVFDGMSGDNAEVELAVYTGALKGGAAPKPAARGRNARNNRNNRNNNNNADNAKTPEESRADRESRAEEIRRKVAERRSQMRAEAARRRAERDAGGEVEEEEGE